MYEIYFCGGSSLDVRCSTVAAIVSFYFGSNFTVFYENSAEQSN